MIWTLKYEPMETDCLKNMTHAWWVWEELSRPTPDTKQRWYTVNIHEQWWHQYNTMANYLYTPDVNSKVKAASNYQLSKFWYCLHPKGWKLKNVPFSFYPWCIQSELFPSWFIQNFLLVEFDFCVTRCCNYKPPELILFSSKETHSEQYFSVLLEAKSCTNFPSYSHESNYWPNFV